MSSPTSTTQAPPTRRWTAFADPVMPGKAKGPRNVPANIEPAADGGNEKGRRGARSAGKLKHLLNMPLDILFEITSQLYPRDLLYLSRVNKAFRAIFMSRNWKRAWTASLESVEGLPACPQDITEADYARLLWENECYVCGAARANKPEYSLRMRFCGPCHHANVKKGAYLATLQFGHKSPMPELLYTLLPRGLYERWSSTFPIPDDMTEKNTDKCGFYIPEFNQISRKFVKLRAPFAPKEPLETFVVGQKRLANDIMRHAAQVIQWEYTSKEVKRQDKDEVASQRRTDIEKRLLSEGWTRSEFHSGWDRHDNETIDQWNQIMDQPRALTERIWKVIAPKLEELREMKKLCILSLQKDERRARRRREIQALLPAFINKWVSLEDDRYIMPNASDIAVMPEVAALVDENDARTEMTAERLDSVAEAILLRAAVHRVLVRRDLVVILHQNRPQDAPKEQLHLDDDNWVLEQLSRATSLFVTTRRSTKLCTYASILYDPEIRSAPWSDAKHSILTRACVKDRWGGQMTFVDIYPIATTILRLSDMSEEASQGDIMEKQFICDCGQKDYACGVSFATMVEHALTEVVRYETARWHGQVGWPAVYMNDHPIDKFSSKIHLANQPLPDLSRLTRTASNPSGLSGYCVHCYGISQGQIGRTLTPDEAATHMSSKHRLSKVLPELLGTSLMDLRAKHDAISPGFNYTFGTARWDCW